MKLNKNNITKTLKKFDLSPIEKEMNKNIIIKK